MDAIVVGWKTKNGRFLLENDPRGFHVTSFLRPERNGKKESDRTGHERGYEGIIRALEMGGMSNLNLTI